MSYASEPADLILVRGRLAIVIVATCLAAVAVFGMAAGIVLAVLTF